MTAIRRTALTLALTLTAVLGSAHRPAQASFSDSASGSTTIAAAAVDRAGQRGGPSPAAGPRRPWGRPGASAPPPVSPATS